MTTEVQQLTHLHLSTDSVLFIKTGHKEVTAAKRSLECGTNSSDSFFKGGSKSVIIIPNLGKLASLENK